MGSPLQPPIGPDSDFPDASERDAGLLKKLAQLRRAAQSRVEVKMGTPTVTSRLTEQEPQSGTSRKWADEGGVPLSEWLPFEQPPLEPAAEGSNVTVRRYPPVISQRIPDDGTAVQVEAGKPTVTSRVPFEEAQRDAPPARQPAPGSIPLSEWLPFEQPPLEPAVEGSNVTVRRYPPVISQRIPDDGTPELTAEDPYADDFEPRTPPEAGGVQGTVAKLIKGAGAPEEWKPEGAYALDEGTPTAVQPEDPGELASLGLGAAQGATMGAGPSLWGASRAVGDALPEWAGGSFDRSKSFIDRYRDNRDALRAKNQAAEDWHPWYYGGAELGGGLASMLVGGAALRGAKAAALAGNAGIAGRIGGFLNALDKAKAATGVPRLLARAAEGNLAGRALAAGARAAPVGAAAGLLGGKADLTRGELGEAAKETAGSALGAGAIGAGGEVLGTGARQLMRKAGPAVRDFAARRADSALGGMLRDARQLASKEDGIAGVKAVRTERGRMLNDRGAIPFMGSREAIAEKLAPLVNEAGEATEQARQALDTEAVAQGVPVQNQARAEIKRFQPALEQARREGASAEGAKRMGEARQAVAGREAAQAKAGLSSAAEQAMRQGEARATVLDKQYGARKAGAQAAAQLDVVPATRVEAARAALENAPVQDMTSSPRAQGAARRGVDEAAQRVQSERGRGVKVRPLYAPQPAQVERGAGGEASALRGAGEASARGAREAASGEAGMRAAEAKQRLVAQQLDAAQQRLSGAGLPVSRKALAQRIRNEVVAPLAAGRESKDIAAQMEELAQRLESDQGGRPMGFEEAAGVRREYDSHAGWDKAHPPKVQQLAHAYRDVANIVRDELYTKADAVDPVLGSNFRKANRAYELLAPAESAATDRALRESVNQRVSLTDALAALRGPHAAAWHHLMRTRGDAGVAAASNAAGKFMEGVGPASGKVAPALSRGAALLNALRSKRRPDWEPEGSYALEE